MADTPDNKTQDEWNEETVYGPSTVIAALDQIEDLVESSRTVPLSASIMINKAEILDLLDQAREALPEDLVAELLPAVSASSPARHAETAPEQRVLSSVCANGHANPTSYTTCRQCGLPLNTPARYRPRPSLGWAVSSSGQRVELVRPVLIGRLPSPENVTTMTGLTAQPLTVDSPELLISRNHLLLDVDEWSVLAQDLSHSNGTILHREGSSPLRLSAGQSVVLRSNDLLDLGDGQTVRLQDLP